MSLQIAMDKMSQKVEFSIVQSIVIKMEVPTNTDNNENCTYIDVKKEVIDDGFDKSYRDFVEASECEELHTSFDIKEEILDGGLVIPTGPSFPSESESFPRIKSEEEPRGELCQNKNGIEADLPEQCSTIHGYEKFTGENFFKCGDCNFSSRWKHNLPRHSMSCKRKKNVQKKSLRQHSKNEKNNRNDDERPFVCNGCDFRSKWKKNLQRHSMICSKKNGAQRKERPHSTTIKNQNRTEESTFKCDNCDFKCRWERNLHRHLLTCRKKRSTGEVNLQHSTGTKPFRCDGCASHFKLERSLHRHLLICSSKESTINSRQHTTPNDKKKTEERPFKCGGCGFKFKWNRNLNRHSLNCNGKKSSRKVNHQHHLAAPSNEKLVGERPFECDSCSFTSKWKQNLARHLVICNRKKITQQLHSIPKMHEKQTEERCESYNRKARGAQHSANPRNIRQAGIEHFKCDSCDFSSKYKHNLLRHSMICSNKNSNHKESLQQPSSTTERKKRTVERTFKCDGCNHIFKWKHHLRRHLLICKGKSSKDINHQHSTSENNKHAVVKSFKCGSCDFSSSWNRSLRRHLLTCIKTKSSLMQGQAGDGLFKCNRCDFSSRWKHSLWRHSSICSGLNSEFTREKALQHSTTKLEKSYNCNSCDKSFRYEYLLNRHVLTHTRVESFKCSICDKVFAQKKNLRQHLSIHRREKVRLESFTEGVVMKRQSCTPTKEKYFRCERCNRKFNQEEGLQSHLVTHMNYVK